MLLEAIELREKEYEILLEILQLNVELTPQKFSDIMLWKCFFFLTSHSLTTLLEKCIKRLHRLTKRGSKQNRNPIRNSKTARPNIQKKKHQPVIFFPASVYTFLARFNILRTRRQSLRGRDPFHRSARRVPHDLMRALMARLLPPNLPRRDAN